MIPEFIQEWLAKWAFWLLIVLIIGGVLGGYKGFVCMSKALTSEEHGETNEITVPKPSDYDRARVPKPGAEGPRREK